MNIGHKIKFFRERKGLTQAQMAEVLNMSVQGYGNIERGDTDVSYSRLELISKELGVKPEILVGFGENNNFVNSNNNINHSIYQVYSDAALVAESEKLKNENLAIKEKNEILEKRITDLEKIIALYEIKK